MPRWWPPLGARQPPRPWARDRPSTSTLCKPNFLPRSWKIGCKSGRSITVYRRCSDEVIHQPRRDHEGVVELGNGPRLFARLVEGWVERAGAGGLQTPILADTEVDALPGVDFLVDPSGGEVLGVYVGRIGSEREGAAPVHAEARTAESAYVSAGEGLLLAAAEVPGAILQEARAIGDGDGAIHTGRAVIDAEHALVERHGS